MRELQILILDLQGNQLGELDLTDSDDFALKLTKSLATITNLGKRSTSFSLDFEVPQTKNNNRLLAGLRFVTHTKEILGQHPCSIIVDGNQVDKGFLYPYESEFDGMYKLNFKGLNNDWVEQLRDVELNQLNWRDYNPPYARSVDAQELFTAARFDFLNSKNSVDYDLTYPYVNRNNTGSVVDWRPQLHLRAIILAMFENIGYTVDSAFLESDWIKAGTNGVPIVGGDTFGNAYDHLGLSVDPSFQMTREQQDLLGQSIQYSTTGIAHPDSTPDLWATNTIIGNTSIPSTPSIRDTYRFPTIINNAVEDDFSRFDTLTSEFTVGLGGQYRLNFEFVNKWAYYDDWSTNSWLPYTQTISPNPPSGQRPPSSKWTIVKNNISDTAIDGTIIYQTPTNVVISDLDPLQTLSHAFSAGDKISVFLEIQNDSFGFTGQQTPLNGNWDYWKLRIKNTSSLTITPIKDVALGDVFRINSHIPKGIKCLTLLQDFKTMFNLYFDVDVNRKVVFIEPRDDFYTGVQEDITDLIDLNTPPTLNYLTSYKNEIVFEYNEDSKDKYLNEWNKVNDKTYAQYKYLFQNNERFEKGQSILKTSLLSASIQGNLNGAPDNIISSIVKEEYLDADNLNKPVNKNYGARVFQLVRGVQYTTTNVNRFPSPSLTAIMENYANTPTFGDKRLTFIGDNGLVQDYYARTLTNIEDTAVITLKINLSLPAYNSWDLKKTYIITEPAEIAGHYITDSIKNFNVTKETPTTIVLVKFKNFDPATVQGGAGNVNVITQTGGQPQPIMCIVGGVIVPCLDNNLQPIYRI